MPRSRSPSPYGAGFDRQGNLVGAAKMQHEWKLQREREQQQQAQQQQQQGQQQSQQPPRGTSPGGARKSSRSPSPYGRGYDRQGNLIGAAKMMHEWKQQREGRGEEQEDEQDRDWVPPGEEE